MLLRLFIIILNIKVNTILKSNKVYAEGVITLRKLVPLFSSIFINSIHFRYIPIIFLSNHFHNISLNFQLIPFWFSCHPFLFIFISLLTISTLFVATFLLLITSRFIIIFSFCVYNIIKIIQQFLCKFCRRLY